MDWKKIGKALLFPHIAILLVLLPVATVFLVYSMIFIGTESVPAYISYVLAFYTLTVWCIKIPALIRFFKTFKKENRFARKWFGDAGLRVNTSLYGTLIWNTAYAVFQLGLGFYHGTFWFYSMAAYSFTSLTLAIINIVRYRKYKSPAYSASKAISLAAACVSMLTLESTMLTTFGDVTGDLLFRKMMLGISGGIISVFIIAMAFYMMIRGNKKIKELNTSKENING